jgi:DNA-binding LacI/PurR family transcriptional regulator
LFDELEHRGFRTVCAVPFPQGYPGNCVSVDPYISARIVIDHLVNLGHKKITFILNEPTELASVQMRIATLREEVARRGLTGVVFHDCRTPMWGDSFAAAHAAMPAVLGAAERPTAIVPISGNGAWAALRYAGQQRMRVPEDFSLLAFDDLPGSALLYPALTSLSADEKAFSQQVLDILWSDETAPRQVSVPTAIIERESTAAV